MEYYASKGASRPRRMYRNLKIDLLAPDNSASRATIITDFCRMIEEIKPTGETQKMKWCLPPFVSNILSNPEKEKVGAALAAKRRRRNEKLLEVFPACSDEYSTDTAFLDAALGAVAHPTIHHGTKFFTLGSCFAVNIANYLKSKGYQVDFFEQIEDLNSPFSNAIMLAVCAAPETARREYVKKWMSVLYPGTEDLEEMTELALQQLVDLRKHLAESDFVIITFGNVVDYFLHDNTGAFCDIAAVAPKFLALKENAVLRGAATQRLKEAGSDFRLGTYGEVQAATESLYTAIRHINPTATLVVTLSPVPLESVLGIQSPVKMAACPTDCVSKSLLRFALHELLVKKEADKNFFYFPAFEIVRWIAPNFGYPAFGNEDASARHVSQHNLAGVYDYFLHRFSKDSKPSETDTGDFELSVKVKKKKRRWWQFLRGR